MLGFMSKRKVKKVLNEMWRNYAKERTELWLKAENCDPGSEEQMRYFETANMCEHFCMALTELENELFD